MKKILIAISVTISAILMALGLQTLSLVNAAGQSNLAPLFYFASSTVFTLTTTNQRLLATSTPTHRVAATIQPTNCTAGQAVYLNLNRDVVAAANTGMAVLASTTQEFRDYPNLPIVQGSVNAITALGTCTVLVTEWRLIQ